MAGTGIDRNRNQYSSTHSQTLYSWAFQEISSPNNSLLTLYSNQQLNQMFCIEYIYYNVVLFVTNKDKKIIIVIALILDKC